MRKYFELLYFGCYYWKWMAYRLVYRLLYLPLQWIGIAIPYIFPFIKKNLAKQGKTPRENADNVLQLGRKISDANISQTFEGGISLYIYLFFVFLYTDLFLILRYIFGYNWCGFYVGRSNVVVIGMTIVAFATVSMFAICGNIGTAKNEKAFRKQGRKEQRKALWVFFGSFFFVILAFIFLWGHIIFQ